MSDGADSSSATWIGRSASVLVVVALLTDGAAHFLAPAQIVSAMQEIGFATELTSTLSVIMVACATLYAVPRTAVLGAILVTGFLGGAVCAHVRLGEHASLPQLISLLLGVLTWGGLYLRDPRLGVLLPLTRSPATDSRAARTHQEAQAITERPMPPNAHEAKEAR